ncbi:AVN_HP_G0119900.mRNA.1.CDS.1 [Saccharomyces cerevisiae]|nr:AVN_HP_G0119900.mRNA.1.CDS.1 [Saccharomyces cerevisiae]CAI6997006.1 AVN_HP_G0119900.mRNA.1.CDS.1 [Saccharomyces cerevisiae]
MFRKLRLSSFILGKDTPNREGHIVYHSLFLQVHCCLECRMVKLELFTKPKTLEQAEEVLEQVRDVLVYFVP